MKTLSLRETLLLAATLALVGLAWLAPPLVQFAHYHHFADQRAWLGVPCALDVLSNLPFALFGAWGPLSVWVWAGGGNLLPWAVLQGAGMVVALYALAKVLELTDHAVYALGGQLVSGHSLKHVAAALAAWPVIGALCSLGQNAGQR